jgi:hypothetical protein
MHANVWFTINKLFEFENHRCGLYDEVLTWYTGFHHK